MASRRRCWRAKRTCDGCEPGAGRASRSFSRGARHGLQEPRPFPEWPKTRCCCSKLSSSGDRTTTGGGQTGETPPSPAAWTVPVWRSIEPAHFLIRRTRKSYARFRSVVRFYNKRGTELYGVEDGQVPGKRQVNRNRNRFPGEDFMLRLTSEETSVTELTGSEVMCRVQHEKTWSSGQRGCILRPCQGQNGNPLKRGQPSGSPGATCRTFGPARSPVPTAAACDDSSGDKRSRLSRATCRGGTVTEPLPHRLRAKRASGSFAALSVARQEHRRCCRHTPALPGPLDRRVEGLTRRNPGVS